MKNQAAASCFNKILKFVMKGLSVDVSLFAPWRYLCLSQNTVIEKGTLVPGDPKK